MRSLDPWTNWVGWRSLTSQFAFEIALPVTLILLPPLIQWYFFGQAKASTSGILAQSAAHQSLTELIARIGVADFFLFSGLLLINAGSKVQDSINESDRRKDRVQRENDGRWAIFWAVVMLLCYGVVKLFVPDPLNWHEWAMALIIAIVSTGLSVAFAVILTYEHFVLPELLAADQALTESAQRG